MSFAKNNHICEKIFFVFLQKVFLEFVFVCFCLFLIGDACCGAALAFTLSMLFFPIYRQDEF